MLNRVGVLKRAVVSVARSAQVVEELARMTDALGREVNLEILQVKILYLRKADYYVLHDRKKAFVVLAR